MNRRPQHLVTPPGPRQEQGSVLVLHSSTAAWAGPRFAADLNSLPLPEQQRILARKRGADQRASLVGRLLLRQGLELFGHSAGDLHKLRYTTYGKPFLPHLDLNFNISHSGDVVVCAMAKGTRIGIDVEHLRAVPIADLAATLDHAQLQEVAAAAHPDRQLLAFWTKKEAVAKCRGEGLNLPMERMTGSAVLVLDGESWHCSQLDVGSDYICHGVTKSAASGWKVIQGLC